MSSYYACAHHPSQEAVAACDSCMKPICKECSDVFLIEEGIHAGGRVCYDCASDLVASNIDNITRFREQVRKERTKMIVVMAVGAFVGLLTGEFIGMISIFLLVFLFVGFKFFKRINQINQCDRIIENDSNALREMRDYFAYTQIMEERRGKINLESLISQGGELFDNSYARAVASGGEAAAQAELRQSVVTISANGEIIRSFAGARR